MAPRCCQCNGARAKCLRCLCRRNNNPCTSCFPGERGCCGNTSPVLSTNGDSDMPDPAPRGPRTASLGVAPVVSSVPASAVSLSDSSHSSGSSEDVLPSDLPSLHSVFQAKVPTYFHVPRKARDSWLHLFFCVIQDIVSSPSDSDRWFKLFMLPRCILHCSTPGARSSTLHVVRSIKEKCRKWLEGCCISLWQEAVCLVRNPQPSLLDPPMLNGLKELLRLGGLVKLFRR